MEKTWLSICGHPEYTQKLFQRESNELVISMTCSHITCIFFLSVFQKYLTQYGYLHCDSREASDTAVSEQSRGGRSRRQVNSRPYPAMAERPDPVTPTPDCTHTPQQIAQALRSYQRTYSLPVTGTLDQATKVQMNVKRCGNADEDIGANSVTDSARQGSGLHLTVKRSLDFLKTRTRRRKATLLVQEKRRQRVLDALEFDTDASSKPNQPEHSSLLHRLFFPKSEHAQQHKQPSQSYTRRLQMLQEYNAMFQAESSSADPNLRQGAFISSKHPEPFVITDPGSTNHRREKRSEPWEGIGRQRLMLNSRDCIRWRLLREGYSERLRVASQRGILSLAFRMWAEVTPLCFIEDDISPHSQIEIPIAFVTGEKNTDYQVVLMARHTEQSC